MNYTMPDTPVWRRVVNYVAKVPNGQLGSWRWQDYIVCVCVCGIAMRHSGMNYTMPDTPVWRRVVNYVAKVPIGPLIAIVQHT